MGLCLGLRLKQIPYCQRQAFQPGKGWNELKTATTRGSYHGKLNILVIPWRDFWMKLFCMIFSSFFAGNFLFPQETTWNGSCGSRKPHLKHWLKSKKHELLAPGCRRKTMGGGASMMLQGIQEVPKEEIQDLVSKWLKIPTILSPFVTYSHVWPIHCPGRYSQ